LKKLKTITQMMRKSIQLKESVAKIS